MKKFTKKIYFNILTIFHTDAHPRLVEEILNPLINNLNNLYDQAFDDGYVKGCKDTEKMMQTDFLAKIEEKPE
jgi:hypothetical protein